MISMKIFLQYLLPKRILSRLAGKLATCKSPQFIKNFWIKNYIKHYGVNLSEAEQTEYQQYACFNDFFSRHLKTSARPIDDDPESIVSPADGSISMLGDIKQDTLIQAKNHHYTVQDLLGGNSAEAEK